MRMIMGTGMEQVGDKWYYWVDAWTAVKGPFNTLVEASQALQKELEDRHGKTTVKAGTAPGLTELTSKDPAV